MGRFFAGVVIGGVVGFLAGSLSSLSCGVFNGASSQTTTEEPKLTIEERESLEKVQRERETYVQDLATSAIETITEARIRPLRTRGGEFHDVIPDAYTVPLEKIENIRNQKAFLYKDCLGYVTQSGVMDIVSKEDFEREAKQTIERWKRLRQ